MAILPVFDNLAQFFHLFVIFNFFTQYRAKKKTFSPTLAGTAFREQTHSDLRGVETSVQTIYPCVCPPTTVIGTFSSIFAQSTLCKNASYL